MDIQSALGAENSSIYYTHPVLDIHQHPWATGNYVLFTGTTKTACHSDGWSNQFVLVPCHYIKFHYTLT